MICKLLKRLAAVPSAREVERARYFHFLVAQLPAALGSLAHVFDWPVHADEQSLSIWHHFREALGRGDPHDGIDILVPSGTPVRSIENVHVVGVEIQRYSFGKEQKHTDIYLYSPRSCLLYVLAHISPYSLHPTLRNLLADAPEFSHFQEGVKVEIAQGEILGQVEEWFFGHEHDHLHFEVLYLAGDIFSTTDQHPSWKSFWKAQRKWQNRINPLHILKKVF